MTLCQLYETWYVTQNTYVYCPLSYIFVTKDVKCMEFIRNLLWHIYCALVTLRGGTFHKPLQFANYCIFLAFPHDFFFRMNIAAVAGTNRSFISLLLCNFTKK